MAKRGGFPGGGMPGNMANLMKQAQKMQKQMEEQAKEMEEKRGVALYSLHSSKGLEWEIVFIPTLLDGVFPSSIEKENLEEEKRLYYVGCSRAKSFLHLSYPKYHYEKLGYFDKKSKFLDY